MRGRKPKPTGLKVLQGNPGKRKINRDEPMYPAMADDCPEHLGPTAKKEWRRLRELFEPTKVFTEADRGALSAYCVAWGRWVEAEHKVKTAGLLIKSPSGYPMQNPWLAIANKAWEQMHKMMPEFGMTPSSRSRVDTGIKKKQSDGLKRLLG